MLAGEDSTSDHTVEESRSFFLELREPNQVTQLEIGQLSTTIKNWSIEWRPRPELCQLQ